jgi:RIO-like serine/threonine protein kinase
VKWIQNWSPEAAQAQEWCAKHELAPAILGVTYEHPFTIVVMQYIEPSQTLSKILASGSKCDILSRILTKVEEGAKRMHKAGYVHGDLREANILVALDTVLFIDFDFAGLTKSAKYPPFLNPDIAWPDGACYNKPILPEHDLYWIDLIKQKYL